ncbi:MAG: Holliday junction resolvase RuvX [Bacteroidota bacterium]
MGRILAIDYGTKRTGLAVTDELKLIAGRLDTIHSSDIYTFLETYFSDQQVDCIVVGYPRRLNNKDTHSTRLVDNFIRSLEKKYPGLEIVRIDERFTSKIAMQAMVQAGVKKAVRREGFLIDSVSATLILQTYLSQKQFQ